MVCTFSQAGRSSLCTSGVVYAGNQGFHHAYMPRTPQKPRRLTKLQRLAKPSTELPWRLTKIKLWRKGAELTQQAVADRLVEMDPDLDYTRESIQRIENGKQRPGVIVLEAMVIMFGAPDLTSLLDRTPEEADEHRQIVALDPKERRRLLRMMEASQDAE